MRRSSRVQYLYSMNIVAKLWLAFILVVGIPAAILLWQLQITEARNIQHYSDLISDSAPGARSNHTFNFRIYTTVAPGGRLEFTPPDGFEILSAPEFGVRNVELVVNGTPRPADDFGGVGVDQVEITSGSPGFIRYTLAPDFSIPAGSEIEFRVGNQTTNTIHPYVSYDATTTSTTTYTGDIYPIVNSTTLGTHEFTFEVWDSGNLSANAGFLISVNERVSIPNANTREKVPPFRFNGSPTSTVGGTTLSVEITLETDEFAFCKYSRNPGVPYGTMVTYFNNTGLIFHSTVVAVTPNTVQQFFVRCLDDEGNFNIDDYIIHFTVNDIPTGISNTSGTTSGNGTGSGNNGTGSGSGGGGNTGGSNGQQPQTGNTSGNGGSGGGGGGGAGGGTGGGAGGAGGFESTDTPFQSGDARVIISGFAYPNSTISIGVDGKAALTTRSNANGSYTATIEAIAKGVYTFGVFATTPDKTKSTTFSTSFTVTGARTSELTNINIAPAIKVTPNPVDPGQVLSVSGYAIPNSTVTLQNGKVKAKPTSEYTATSDGQGQWATTIPTTGFSKGSYQVRAKSAQLAGVSTNLSDFTIYGVGEKTAGPLNADLNRDTKVNLIDFSILLFWWNSDGGTSDPSADINSDKKVNLTDFSILLFNWTG